VQSTVLLATIVVRSKDNKGVGVNHKVNSPKYLLRIFVDDDGTVLVTVYCTCMYNLQLSYQKKLLWN